MRNLYEKTLSSRSIYQGKLIQVRVDQVRLPNQAIAEREIVKHPGAVAVSAITTENKMVLVRQFRKALEKTIYEIPAGKLNPGENPQDCAIRELKEETGYLGGEIRFVESFYTSPGFADEIIHLFRTTDLKKGEATPDADEFVETVELSKEVCMAYIKEGHICDAKTLIAIYLW